MPNWERKYKNLKKVYKELVREVAEFAIVIADYNDDLTRGLIVINRLVIDAEKIYKRKRPPKEG